MEADNSRLPQGICPLTNGWLNHIRENWHDFSSALPLVDFNHCADNFGNARFCRTRTYWTSSKQGQQVFLKHNKFPLPVGFHMFFFICRGSKFKKKKKVSHNVLSGNQFYRNNTMTVLIDLDTPGTSQERDWYLL